MASLEVSELTPICKIERLCSYVGQRGSTWASAEESDTDSTGQLPVSIQSYEQRRLRVHCGKLDWIIVSASGTCSSSPAAHPSK